MRNLARNRSFCAAVFGAALFAALLSGGGTSLWAVDFPGHGADAIQHLYSPGLAGAGAFTTTTGGAPASAVNPAQGGEAQRVVFNLGYMGLARLGDESEFGSAVDMGLLVPTRFAVFGTSIRFIHSPFEAFPVGSVFSGNLSVAKEVFPRMSVGMGLNFGFGTDNVARDWTLNGDLGFRWNTGRLGPLENFTWAATIRSMGRSWAPTWFTPAGGVSFDLLRIRGRDGGRDPLLVNAQADLEIPSIIHFDWISLIFKAGLRFEIAQMVDLSVSWPSGSGLNARELAEGGSFPALPSVGIGVNIPLPTGGRRVAGGRLPTDGDLRTDLAFRPLYDGVTAMGAGVTWNVGIADRRPPVITIAHTETLYFSPNNDGRADFLEFPIGITDERYVASWYWEIRDEEGRVVRTIRNRELRPQTINFRNFMGNLFSVREHVEVPPTLRWDGIADSGEPAPDGRYFFTITAADDSGNTVTSQVFEAVLRNTPPEIAIDPIDDAMRIFSPGGARDTITFTHRGSYEHAWESGIYDMAGNRVRTFDVESGNPGPRVWDGRNDQGIIVPDGVYTYRIAATDRAMNRTGASLANIIVNTIRPQVSVFIADPWFSPGTASERNTLAMGLNVPSRDEVTEWTIRVKDGLGNVRRTISPGQGGLGATWTATPAGMGSPMIASVPDMMHFDGRGDDGAILEEGVFTAELSVQYLNGFVSRAVSPAFNLRTTPPRATVRADYLAFAPVADSIQQEMVFRLEGSHENLWIGEIRRADRPGEVPVRAFRFAGHPPAELRWDGHGEAGTFAADGEYTFHLFSMDQAGNLGQSNVIRFTLSTRDAPVMMNTDLRAFSPTGAGARNSINLIAQVQETQGVVSHRVDILDGAGQTVRTFQGQGLPPAAISWDGRNAANAVVPEGLYTARLEILYAHGIQPHAVSLPFEVDVTPPRATVSAPYTIFSPHGRRGTIPFNISTEANDEWEASIVNAAGTPVRTWNWRGAAPGIFWDGRDGAGNIVPDGTYQLVLRSVDEAGNSTSLGVPGIVLDARIPQLILTASETAIAPRPGQHNAELVRFGIMTSLPGGIESWSLEIRDGDGAAIRRFASAPPNSPVPPPPASIAWNGLTDGGGVREGLLTPVLTVNYIKGDVAVTESAPILVHVTGPALSFAAQPRYFTPDNDGVDDELYIGLAAASPVPIESWYLEILQPVAPFHVFHRMEGRGSPAERLIWDGRSGRGELVQSAMNYPIRFSATDRLGNSSTIEAEIGVGILVIRDGDRLRIQVPAIIFAANAADFSGLPAYQVENNLRVLRQVAESLNRFRDYRITVEGHANPTFPPGPARNNEAPILQRLSEARARTVLDQLARNGVNRNRMTSVGIGGNSPVVAFEEHDLWWQNRRVEFILVR
ncbi:MAG: OmpA family protein [Treponema sp.]|nr:OmpA family protein [Treponema sp.]